MKDNYGATAEVAIRASAGEVWDALTNAEMIKQYLFGTEATSDWKVGSPITYRGIWQGKAYEDKGKVLEVVMNRRLKTTYWSSLSGAPEAPENYNTVTYELSESPGITTVTVTQDNCPTRESADHSAENWKAVLQAMKKLLET